MSATASIAVVPDNPWQPHLFSSQELASVLSNASNRVNSFVNSMFIEPDVAPRGRDELESLREELSRIDKELHITTIITEILVRSLAEAKLRYSSLSLNRRDKYGKCQELAELRRENRQIHLPPEVVSYICSFNVRPFVPAQNVARCLEKWGNVLPHSVGIAAQDFNYNSVLSDPSLSRFKKSLNVWADIRVGRGVDPLQVRLIQDTHQRGDIEFLSIKSTLATSLDRASETRIHPDLLRIADRLEIGRYHLRPTPRFEEPMVWNEDAAPQLRSVHGSLHCLPALGTLLRNITSMEIVLFDGDRDMDVFELRFRGLILPCLKQLTLGVEPGIKLSNQGRGHGATLQFPSLSDLSIKTTNAVDMLSILKTIECGSLQSLDLEIDTTYRHDVLPHLVEYLVDYLCKVMVSLKSLNFGFVSMCEQEPNKIKALRDLFERLIVREQGGGLLPELIQLEIPIWSPLLETIMSVLATRATRSKPIRTSKFNNFIAEPDSLIFDRMGLYVTDVFIQARLDAYRLDTNSSDDEDADGGSEDEDSEDDDSEDDDSEDDDY